ncbi:hypothetical protein B0I35DRAFT_482968 [Stachybotrys elegans]|uniref:2EXR domain-containing protein n=1 Tax=Stachybotrys elegans TaxID=80388 RepID=A0A8K0WMS8_9HYPO|nr:hypothetical protein B0I35DRAFT_482968 [Stachybotrys elegans]
MGKYEKGHRSDDTSGDSASSFTSAGANDSLDTEAAESDDVSLLHSRDEEDADATTFHPLSRLPPELRRHIWKLFCPEITLKSRLLDITIGPPSEKHARECSWPPGMRPWTARDGHILKTMTLNTRRVLSVNQESRTIALKSFPDCLSLDLASGDAIVRFNKETDVILLTGYGMDHHDTRNYHFPDFAAQIKQLAISATLGYNSTAGNSADLQGAFFRQFPNLERVFFLLENVQHGTTRNLRWCVPEYVHELFVDTFKEAPCHGEDMQMVFCWPNVNKYKTFHDIHGRKCHFLPKDELLELGIESYPMAIFQSGSGLAWYKNLQAKLASRPPDLTPDIDTESGEASDEVSEPVQYESDGIDDDPISDINED